MQFHTHSEPGGKVINEDYLIARRHPQSSDGYICLLADGQGGRSNGALAAKAACETAWRLASERRFASLLAEGGWQTILQQADLAAMTTGGFTTLVAVAVDPKLASGASCGDSKAYFGQPNKMHDLAEWTHAQARNPPVGSGSANFNPFIGQAVAGGRILIVSDGVWKYCGYDSLRSAMQSLDPSSATSFLRDAVLQRSGSNLPDDFSVIAVDVS